MYICAYMYIYVCIYMYVYIYTYIYSIPARGAAPVPTCQCRAAPTTERVLARSFPAQPDETPHPVRPTRRRRLRLAILQFSKHQLSIQFTKGKDCTATFQNFYVVSTCREQLLIIPPAWPLALALVLHLCKSSHVTHTSESYLTYERVMSRMWMHHVTHMNESCHTYAWVTPYVWISHVTHIITTAYPQHDPSHSRSRSIHAFGRKSQTWLTGVA